TGPARFDLVVTPEPNAYFPPVELRHDDFVSGYVVPALRATASGTLCEGSSCRRLEGAPAYHDHNWGVWRETTWDWGQGRGRSSSLVYGGVLTPDSLESPGSTPYFLAVVDSLGVEQVLRFRRIDYRGEARVEGALPVVAPRSFTIAATRGADSVLVA